MAKLARIDFLPVKDLHDTMIFLATEMNKIIEKLNEIDEFLYDKDHEKEKPQIKEAKKANNDRRCQCISCQISREYKESLKKIMGAE